MNLVHSTLSKSNTCILFLQPERILHICSKHWLIKVTSSIHVSLQLFFLKLNFFLLFYLFSCVGPIVWVCLFVRRSEPAWSHPLLPITGIQIQCRYQSPHFQSDPPKIHSISSLQLDNAFYSNLFSSKKVCKKRTELLAGRGLTKVARIAFGETSIFNIKFLRCIPVFLRGWAVKCA